MQNHAKTSGILSIVSGVFGLLEMIMLIVFTFFFRTLIGLDPVSAEMEAQVLGMVIWIYVGAGIFSGILGVIGIIGGVYALKRRYWGWALTAAIAGTLNFFPTGIPAIIFAAMGKTEFETPPESTEASPV
jgi:hypothetical protein